jgi:hypothetical protein
MRPAGCCGGPRAPIGSLCVSSGEASFSRVVSARDAPRIPGASWRTVLNPDRADLDLEAIVLEERAVVVAGLGEQPCGDINP